ncbi:DUF3021 domain-containing protein [Enterococcus sp. LJL98]
MTNKIALNLINGFILGVFIGLLFSIFFSFIYSGDTYIPMTPGFKEIFSNELFAFLISVLLWGVIGLIFTATNFIFTSTDWGIAKMTAIHALVSYILFLPIALYLNWIHFTVANTIIFTIIYIMIYIIIWNISMFKVKKDIHKINSKIQ